MEQAESTPSPRNQREAPLWGFDRDELAYVAPMVCFLLIMGIGSFWKAAYPWAYVVRTVFVGALLVMMRRRYTPIRWDYWWLGVIMGVLGIVQWIGMDALLQHAWPSLFALEHGKAFDPLQHFGTPAAAWGWIIVRLIGACIVVPFMEELFWRDYLWRRLLAPADFKLAQIGEWSPLALFAVTAAFSLVHAQIPTALVWGLMVGGLLLYTRSLGACIIMHAVTNFLLGLYVLNTHQWAWWQ